MRDLHRAPDPSPGAAAGHWSSGLLHPSRGRALVSVQTSCLFQTQLIPGGATPASLQLGFHRGCRAAQIDGRTLLISTCLRKHSVSNTQLRGSEPLWLVVWLCDMLAMLVSQGLVNDLGAAGTSWAGAAVGQEDMRT